MIIKHMESDPNATKHAQAGLYASMTALVALPLLGLFNTLLAALAVPFIMGVAIEVVQHVYRVFKKSNQNTFKENVLDVIQTGLWYITFYVNKDK